MEMDCGFVNHMVAVPRSKVCCIPLLITLIYKMYIEEDFFLISLNTIRLFFATSGVISLPKPRDAKLS